MANKTDVKQTGLMHRIFKDLDVWDLLSGALGLGGIVGGYMGTHPDKSPDGKAPPPIAPKQEDEGNFSFLLAVLAKGNNKDIVRSKQLSTLHNALLTIHTDYAEQFRNYFFSVRGVKSDDMIKQLVGLVGALQKQNDGLIRTKMISQSSNVALILALELCQRIDDEIKNLYPGQISHEEATDTAIKLIAQKMTTDRRELPGTLVTHTEEKFSHIGRALNEYLQSGIQKRSVPIEKKPMSKIIIVVISVIALFMLIELGTMLFTPNQKQYTPNPLDKVTQKVSAQVEELYPTKPQQGE